VKSASNTGELVDDLDDNADYTVIPKKPLQAIKDVGFVEEMNQKYRRTMEVRKKQLLIIFLLFQLIIIFLFY